VKQIKLTACIAQYQCSLLVKINREVGSKSWDNRGTNKWLLSNQVEAVRVLPEAEDSIGLLKNSREANFLLLNSVSGYACLLQILVAD
jgi:hypothetical protein